jgi:hypothetical protein
MDSHNDEPDVAQALEHSIVSDVADGAGPVHVLSSVPEPAGGTDYEISASRLVSVDPEDPTLADVFVPVPVGGHVSVAQDGTVAPELEDVSADAAREVQAWARTLIASGSVAGLPASATSYGPPVRPTHELIADSTGRRIIRRIGFSAA